MNLIKNKSNLIRGTSNFHHSDARKQNSFGAYQTSLKSRNHSMNDRNYNNQQANKLQTKNVVNIQSSYPISNYQNNHSKNYNLTQKPRYLQRSNFKNYCPEMNNNTEKNNNYQYFQRPQSTQNTINPITQQPLFGHSSLFRAVPYQPMGREKDNKLTARKILIQENSTKNQSRVGKIQQSCRQTKSVQIKEKLLAIIISKARRQHQHYLNQNGYITSQNKEKNQCEQQQEVRVKDYLNFNSNLFKKLLLTQKMTDKRANEQGVAQLKKEI